MYQAGISFALREGSSFNSIVLNLNRSGIWRPLILQFFVRRSSKKGCKSPASGLSLFFGEYSSIFEMKSINSGLTLLFQNTYKLSLNSLSGLLSSSSLATITAASYHYFSDSYLLFGQRMVYQGSWLSAPTDELRKSPGRSAHPGASLRWHSLQRISKLPID